MLLRPWWITDLDRSLLFGLLNSVLETAKTLDESVFERNSIIINSVQICHCGMLVYNSILHAICSMFMSDTEDPRLVNRHIDLSYLLLLYEYIQLLHFFTVSGGADLCFSL